MKEVREMGTNMKQLLGGMHIVTGENSALPTIVPAFRKRAYGAGAALVDIAPDSVPWSTPVS